MYVIGIFKTLHSAYKNSYVSLAIPGNNIIICENWCYLNLEGGARNVIPLIVHVTHFYYYKNILHLVQN